MIKERKSSRSEKKADKRERIRLAARRLFSEFGYDNTTMRDVAREAHVALGTVSLYATDKRDLCLMVFNDIVGSLYNRSVEATSGPQKDLLSALMAFFGVQLQEFYLNLTLTRALLQINYFPSGKHGDEYVSLTNRVIGKITELVREARSNGEIECDFTDEAIARHFFLTFSVTIRFWIAQARPDLTEAMEGLESQFRISIYGIKKRH